MTADKKQRRILCNDDGWIMGEAWPPLTVNDLRERMVSTYEGSGVDALFWCVGNREVYKYETTVGERFGDGYDDLDEAAARHAANIKSLVEECGGPLTAMVGLCHEAGMDIFPSLRMNSHYATDASSHRGGRFRRDHPDLLIGRGEETFPEGSIEWGVSYGADYAHAQVRAHMAAVINELFERFDVDGVELDFMRHPAFFRIDEAYANRYLMTDLLRKVRGRMSELSATKGRTLELSVRVPPTLADAARIGLDVKQWMAEGLVDIVVAGGGFMPFDMPLEEFVAAAQGTGCQVYGCIEHLRPAVDEPTVKAIASRFWSAGAAGVYLFNYFGKPPEWKRRVLSQVADPEALKREDKLYHLDLTDRLVPRDLHDYSFRYAVPAVQLPVTLAEPLSGRGPVLKMMIGDDVEAAAAEGALRRCVLKLSLNNISGEDEYDVLVNGELLSSAARTASYGGWRRLEWTQFPTRLKEIDHGGGTLEYEVAGPPFRRGENEIEVRLVRRTVQQPSPVVVRDLTLSIEYDRD